MNAFLSKDLYFASYLYCCGCNLDKVSKKDGITMFVFDRTSKLGEYRFLLGEGEGSVGLHGNTKIFIPEASVPACQVEVHTGGQACPPCRVLPWQASAIRASILSRYCAFSLRVLKEDWL